RRSEHARQALACQNWKFGEQAIAGIPQARRGHIFDCEPRPFERAYPMYAAKSDKLRERARELSMRAGPRYALDQVTDSPLANARPPRFLIGPVDEAGAHPKRGESKKWIVRNDRPEPPCRPRQDVDRNRARLHDPPRVGQQCGEVANMLEHIGREYEVDACIGQRQVDAVIIVDRMIRHGGRGTAREIERAYVAAPGGDDRSLEAAAAADFHDYRARREPVADRFE